MKRLALLGFPNTGKSTLFNRLTGLSQRTGNWPGLTVELAQAKVLLGGAMVEVVDLPGIHDLTGYSDDEAIVRQVISSSAFDGFVLVLNACQLDRQLPLALQLIACGLPCIVVLNMADEAKRMAIQLHLDALSEQLGVPVLLVSAKNMQGWSIFQAALSRMVREASSVRVASPSVALDGLLDIETAMVRSRDIVEATWCLPSELPPQFTEKVDRWLMHSWLGVPFFLAIMALLFNTTYTLGKPLQVVLGEGLDWVKEQGLVLLISGLPAILQSLVLDGLWQGVVTVLTFTPILFIFFVLMALVEDSGYLARAAFLTDALMARLGLDGRGFVMQLMGFGCNVPAIMGTRVMRDRGQRLLSMLIIPFSLCSARLQVVVFFASVLFSPRVAPWILTGMYALSLSVAILSAWIFKRRYCGSETFLLEVPPYRLPSLRHIVSRAFAEVRSFVELASTFILLGVALVWLLTHIPAGHHGTLADALGQLFSPVLDPIGIRHELAVALLFGFVAKEILLGSLAVIYGVPEAGLGAALVSHLDWVAATSFLLFTLIYIPCVSTIAIIRRESRSLAFTTLTVVWSIGLAWVVSFVFYQTAMWLL